MKAKNILAGLLVASICLPAFGQEPEMPQRATVEARGDSVIIRKGQGNLRIRIYLRKWKSTKASIWKKKNPNPTPFWMRCHSSPKRREKIRMNRTTQVCTSASHG